MAANLSFVSRGAGGESCPQSLFASGLASVSETAAGVPALAPCATGRIPPTNRAKGMWYVISHQTAETLRAPDMIQSHL